MGVDATNKFFYQFASMQKHVLTVDQLVEQLGGTIKAAEELGTYAQQVTHWKKKGRIPAHLYLAHNRALSRLGVDAPVTIWGFRGAKPRRSRAEAAE